jgi:hypothetical protein
LATTTTALRDSGQWHKRKAALEGRPGTVFRRDGGGGGNFDDKLKKNKAPKEQPRQKRKKRKKKGVSEKK